MKAYSLDLRERILRAIDAGESRSEVARRFAVARATVKRYLARRRETGACLPKPIPGRPAAIRPDEHPALAAQLRAAPDATLAEHTTQWAQTHGVRVSSSTLSRTLARLNWTRKKRA